MNDILLITSFGEKCTSKLMLSEVTPLLVPLGSIAITDLFLVLES